MYIAQAYVHLIGFPTKITQTQRVPLCQSLMRPTIQLARNGICTGPKGWPMMKVTTAPPTCHMMQLITRHHHMIQVSTRDSHASQGGPTPATCVVVAMPTPSRACTCFGEPQELPGGPKYKITVEHTGETQLELHEYPRHPTEVGGNWEG